MNKIRHVGKIFRLIAPVCLWIDMYDKVLRMEDDLMKLKMVSFLYILKWRSNLVSSQV